ncbi:MAG: hypothetical protein ACO3FX_11135, partial [Gemmobacter sp.]
GFGHAGRDAPALGIETAIAAVAPDGRWIPAATMLPTDGGAGVSDAAGALVAMVDGEGRLIPAAEIGAWVQRMAGPATAAAGRPETLRVLCLP